MMKSARFGLFGWSFRVFHLQSISVICSDNFFPDTFFELPSAIIALIIGGYLDAVAQYNCMKDRRMYMEVGPLKLANSIYSGDTEGDHDDWYGERTVTIRDWVSASRIVGTFGFFLFVFGCLFFLFVCFFFFCYFIVATATVIRVRCVLYLYFLL